MSTALSYSKYHLEVEEVKLSNTLKTSKKLSRLNAELNTAKRWNHEERKEKVQHLNDLKVDFFEERIALLEGGVSSLPVKSLNEARRLVIKNLALPGDNVITINSLGLLYDKTITQESNIQVKNAYDGQITTIEGLIDDRTRAIFIETLSPDYSIPDFLKISAVAKKAEVPLIVDNTAGAVGFVAAPLKNGADITILSTSSLFKSGSKVIGAVVVDGGSFNWQNKKFGHFSGYINLYHSTHPEEFLFVNFLRNQFSLRLKGSSEGEEALSIIEEVEKLPSLLKKQSVTSVNLANWLKKNRRVKSVEYPGIPSSRNYFNALRYFRNSFGNKIKFVLHSEEASLRHFLSHLQESILVENPAEDPGFQVQFNSTDLSIEIIVGSGSFDEITDKLESAFLEL